LLAENHLLIVVSGFSGSGKGTIMKRLLSDYPAQYALSISITTRAPRQGEVHGKEYFFLSTDEFETKIQKKELLEYAKYVNNYYGTPKEYVESQLSQGKNVILEIETQGALQIKKNFPQSLLIFISPGNAAELSNRLKHRGTEDEATIRSRLAQAAKEAEHIKDYDYIVINDDLEACVLQVHAIIQNERCLVSRNLNMIKEMEKELQCFLKGE
jgi:guanylate kinase